MSIEELDVLIVGAGVSGIGMGCALKTHCPDKRFAIVERRENIGGTWDLFRYPGVRSDSDMHTYGYRLRPWNHFEVLASGSTIRGYLADTVRALGLERHILHGLKTTDASWSSAEQRWTVIAHGAHGSPGAPPRRFRCRWLVMATGYYDHDSGYTPMFDGIASFDGRIVHPQQWPADLDVRGQRVVVVGSGATAVTLVPAITDSAAHVTLLQRSPSYFFSVPTRDPLTRLLSRVLPRRWAFAMARRRNQLLAHALYQASRRWPQRMRAVLLGRVERQLGGQTDMRHFTPQYMPWDQSLCIVPDADLFTALRCGKATITTDRIAGFSGRTIQLHSGASLEADILVTATGLQLQSFGGTRLTVDGRLVEPQQRMFYKGVLMEGVPNFAWIVGYINASWTLKADLASSYLCRLLEHLDTNGLGVAMAHDREGCRLDESVFGDLNAGYVRRAGERLPRQGSKAPWRVTHHYPSDKAMLLRQPIDDGVLGFEPRHAADAPPGGARPAVSAL
ncbi:MAG: NAD(P)/FAD-dependent oxidoreductase [Rubrivivax sp.]